MVQVISVGIAVVIGVGNLIVQGALNNINITPGNALVLLTAVIGASQAAYVVLWTPTKIEPAINRATTPTTGPTPVA
jgi:hypothetical protein